MSSPWPPVSATGSGYAVHLMHAGHRCLMVARAQQRKCDRHTGYRIRRVIQHRVEVVVHLCRALTPLHLARVELPPITSNRSPKSSTGAPCSWPSPDAASSFHCWLRLSRWASPVVAVPAVPARPHVIERNPAARCANGPPSSWTNCHPATPSNPDGINGRAVTTTPPPFVIAYKPRHLNHPPHPR